MKTLVGKVVAGATAVLSSGVFAVAVAQTFTPPAVQSPVNITSTTDLVNVIGKMATFAATVLIALTILLVIYAGYLYMTGTEDNIKKAKTQLIYIAVGVALILVSASIPPLVRALLT